MALTRCFVKALKLSCIDALFHFNQFYLKLR
jgi:hypothetical protein